MSQGSNSSSMRKHAARLALVIIALTSCYAAAAQLAIVEQPSEFTFQAPVPLGAEHFKLLPSKRDFHLMASVETEAFDGVHVLRSRANPSVTRPDGTPMSSYPESLQFRVTASALKGDAPIGEPTKVSSETDMNQYLLGMRFRLKVFRGIDMQMVEPTATQLIGVPPDQPFEERVYRVTFDTRNVPLDARLVLEVLAPDGERLCRFHLEVL
ncbi:MAG TPA: hypothetical protein VEG32_12740 [Clostridia bacterium]|nr:hypothetical protein [Clostridia bacterium]